jgi:aminoglycoside phosphotransferase family enzyme/predicted kinase
MNAQPDEGALSQARVLAFLGDPRAHRDATVRRIDTHASSVFLAGQRALKVKRAIRLPYLDYSTLALRKAACEAEFAINKPNAPEIYRGVVAIVQNDNGRLEIGGRGTPVEWALEMARFDETRTLDRIARRQRIDSGLAVAIADAILRSHDAAERSRAPWAQTIPTLIARNTDRFRSTHVLCVAQVDQLDASSMAAFDAVGETLAGRCASGFVRRCHGDLHLANIALIDDRPMLFDAIEFDPAMATTEVLYDLAFPIMDLLYFKQAEAANIVFNRYLAESDDANLDSLNALQLFLSLRAAIRANVLVTQAERGADQQAVERARSYFALACDLIMPKAARLVAIGGTSGTGKSVLARALASAVAPAPGAIVLRSDVLRKKMFGVPETEPLPADAYQPKVSEQLYDALASKAARILQQGISVIVDAAFLRGHERDAIRRVAQECGVPFTGLFLRADLATRLARLAERRNDASDANAEVAKLQERYDIGPLQDWATIDASGSLEQTRAAGLAELGLSRGS